MPNSGACVTLAWNFVQAPTPAGEVKVAVLNDTCGNLIQLIQLVETAADG